MPTNTSLYSPEEILRRLYSGDMGSLSPSAPPTFRASDWWTANIPDAAPTTNNPTPTSTPTWITNFGGRNTDNWQTRTGPNGELQFAIKDAAHGGTQWTYQQVTGPDGKQYMVPVQGSQDRTYMAGGTPYGPDVWVPLAMMAGAGYGIYGAGAGAGTSAGAGATGSMEGGGFIGEGVSSGIPAWDAAYTGAGGTWAPGFAPAAGAAAPSGGSAATPSIDTPPPADTYMQGAGGNGAPSPGVTGGPSTVGSGAAPATGTGNPFVDGLVKMGLDPATAKLVVALGPTALTALGGGFSGKGTTSTSSTSTSPEQSQAQRDIARSVSGMLPEYIARDRERSAQMMALANQAAQARSVIGPTGIMGGYRPRGVFG